MTHENTWFLTRLMKMKEKIRVLCGVSLDTTSIAIRDDENKSKLSTPLTSNFSNPFNVFLCQRFRS